MAERDYIEYKCKIKVLTGLHIGGESGKLDIGWVDSPIIRTKSLEDNKSYPYIPGSTIKGKMRSLLEMSTGLYDEKNGGVSSKELYDERTLEIEEVSKEMQFNIPFYFGSGKNASKLYFEDFYLEEKISTEIVEEKTEVSVPRFSKGEANPRTLERVIPGVVFTGKIVLSCMLDKNEEKKVITIKTEARDILEKGIELLNVFWLGGGTSRGNGRIHMSLIEKDEKNK